MEFDKNRVYTAVNADELKVGSTVFLADCLASLKKAVEDDDQSYVKTITNILDDGNSYRFVAGNLEWALAYLISEPEEKKLKWTDLKIGDVIRYKTSGVEHLVTGLDKRCKGNHIYAANAWIADNDLERSWEKVDTVLFSFSSLEDYERQVTE